MQRTDLYAVDPLKLVAARTLCHAACQWPSRSARANLTALPDDSHSNLGWDEAHSALVSRVLDPDANVQLGFSFADQALIWLKEDGAEDRLDLARASEHEIGAWVDDRLASCGLEPSGKAEMPYELDLVDYARFDSCSEETTTLGAWYAAAQTSLDRVVDEFAEISVLSPSVRCWPHHFDLAVLFQLEEGDPESARSIGIGLSPGDDSYPEPYFYCSPWPPPTHLPEPPDPLMWHTKGFTSLVGTATALSRSGDPAPILVAAMHHARSALN